MVCRHAGQARWRAQSTFFFFQAEDGIRDLVRSRGLGDVYKRQDMNRSTFATGLLAAICLATPSLAQTPELRVLTYDLSLIHI